MTWHIERFISGIPSQFWSLKMAFFLPSVTSNSLLLCKREFSSLWGSTSASRNAWITIKWFPGLGGLYFWAYPGMFIVLRKMTVKCEGIEIPCPALSSIFFRNYVAMELSALVTVKIDICHLQNWGGEMFPL